MKPTARLARFCPIALLFFLCSCIIAPIPSPTRRVGPAGKIKTLDMKAFTPGKTTLEECSRQFDPVDTRVKLPHMYWARWEKSKWTWVAAVGGPGAAAGGGSRFWSAENLVAEFDDSGVLKQWRMVRDADLAHELSRFVVRGNRWESNERLQFDVMHMHRLGEAGAVMTLQKDSVELAEEGKHAGHSYKIAPTEITEVTTRNVSHDTSSVDISVVRVALRFRKPVPAGDQLKIVTNPEHLVDILDYVRERAPEAVIK